MLEYEFSSKVQTSSGQKSEWFFVLLPKDMSEHIRHFTTDLQRGFKSLKVNATIGKSQWKTSIFPSKDEGAYFMLLNKAVRDAEKISAGDKVKTKIDILGL